MAAKYINKVKKVNKVAVETTYRIDADFVPTDINEICMEFIENYCVANNELEWLVETINTEAYEVTRKNKETGETYVEIVPCNNYPFVNLRRDFTEKFFPQILKSKNAPKAETWKEKINRLYGK